VHASKVMCCVPQLRESTNSSDTSVVTEYLRSILKTYDRTIEWHCDVLNTEQSQDKDFLLKIYLENHKL
jgi:hypothetical protein